MRKYNPQKRIFVTDSAGFLFSHLNNRLLKRGNEAVSADNLCTGTKRKLDQVHNNPRFQSLCHDITFHLYIQVDQIYNLACSATPIQYQHDPVQTTKTSMHGVINMLGLANRLRVRTFQACTSEVYGDPSLHSQTEAYWRDVNSFGPRSYYDEGKRYADTLFFTCYRQHKLDIPVARIFNTCGPRMHPNHGRLVSNFIVQALHGDGITICEERRQKRSFFCVDDLIGGFMRFMDLPCASDQRGFPSPINIGNSVEFTIRQLAETVIGLTGSKSKLLFRPLPADDPMRRKPDITLAREDLGWEPKIQLKQGSDRSLAYFDKLLTSGD
jgi:UDP-glucuronate decarboxylase